MIMVMVDYGGDYGDGGGGGYGDHGDYGSGDDDCYHLPFQADQALPCISSEIENATQRPNNITLSLVFHLWASIWTCSWADPAQPCPSSQARWDGQVESSSTLLFILITLFIHLSMFRFTINTLLIITLPTPPFSHEGQCEVALEYLKIYDSSNGYIKVGMNKTLVFLKCMFPADFQKGREKPER